MNKGQWTTKYIRRSSVKLPTFSSSSNPLSPSPTLPNGPTSPEKGGDTGGGGGRGEGDSKINGAVIGGGIAGGIAVIATIVFFIIRRRRPRRGPDSTGSSDISNKHSEATSRNDQGFPSIENTSDGSAFGKGIILSKTYQQPDKPSNPQYISHKHSQGTLDYPVPQPKPSSPHGKTLYPLPSFPPPPPLTTLLRPQPADPQDHHKYYQQQHPYQPYPMQDPSTWQYGYPQYHEPLAFTETTPLSSNTRGLQRTVKSSQTASNLELQERNQELQEQLIWMQTELSRRQTDQQQR
ncbi:MAG: hypothetical protein J3R72DRAFT_200128 [Linnemannia gamsii]|nr:MAG: hypothetical protein J3R72DRAFT_200128 [Linnemannia gamsii]